MKVAGKDVKIFKMKNRQGYAAICCDHLTEGRSAGQAVDRMAKALKRTARKHKK